MNQALKNQYYSLIKENDYNTLELINVILSKIETLLLTEQGKNHREEFLDLISILEFSEKTLYERLKQDIEKGIILK